MKTTPICQNIIVVVNFYKQSAQRMWQHFCQRRFYGHSKVKKLLTYWKRGLISIVSSLVSNSKDDTRGNVFVPVIMKLKINPTATMSFSIQTDILTLFKYVHNWDNYFGAVNLYIFFIFFSDKGRWRLTVFFKVFIIIKLYKLMGYIIYEFLKVFCSNFNTVLIDWLGSLQWTIKLFLKPRWPAPGEKPATNPKHFFFVILTHPIYLYAVKNSWLYYKMNKNSFFL